MPDETGQDQKVKTAPEQGESLETRGPVEPQWLQRAKQRQEDMGADTARVAQRQRQLDKARKHRSPIIRDREEAPGK